MTKSSPGARIGLSVERAGLARLLCFALAAMPLGAQASRPASVSLGDVLRAAAAQHPLVAAAQARVESALGARRTAGTFANPALTYWIEGANFPWRTAPPGLERESQLYATLPIQSLYQRWSRVRSANEQVTATRADLARARQLVALDAARAFFRVAQAQTAVAANEEVRRRLIELETYNRARVSEGVTAESDLIRTQVELGRLDAETALHRAELSMAWAALRPYFDASSGGADTSGRDTLRVVTQVPGEAAPAALPPLDTLALRARTVRPDLLAARARAAEARAQVGVERTLALRQVDLTFGAKQVAGATSMIASIALPIPVFDQNRGETQRAVGARTAAEQELAWAERRAMAELAGAYEASRLLTEQVNRLAGTFLSRADEARRIAAAGYQEGAMTLLQVLDASRAYAEARVLYARTVFAAQTSRLDLGAAVGLDLLDGSTIDAPSIVPGQRP